MILIGGAIMHPPFIVYTEDKSYKKNQKMVVKFTGGSCKL